MREVIDPLAVETWLGEQDWRGEHGTERHDGEAATCEDFVVAIEDGAGLDLAQFRKWYEQAGTPKVEAETRHDAATGEVTVTLRQTVPPTPGQPTKAPVPIPLRTALFDRASGSNRGRA